MDEEFKPYLMEHPLFRWLDSRYIGFIAAQATAERFAKGEYLLRLGDQADRFYIILHGTVQLECPRSPGAPTVVQTLHSAEVVGWSWLVAPYRWQFDARAATPVSVIKLGAEVIRTRCEQDHDLGYELLKRFSSVMLERLHACRSTMNAPTGN